MKNSLDLVFLIEHIVTVNMTLKKSINGQCYNKVERYGNKSKHFTNSSYLRKKNNSFSGIQTQEKTYNNNSVNYYSDNSSSYVQSNAKKCKPRRSLSSSPTLYSHYAGAKFSEPPSPCVLPLPPTHWTESLTAENTENTPRSLTPVEFEKLGLSCTSTPILKVFTSANMNQSVELFFKKCSFNQIETCKDFTKQLKTLLNVPA
ncbi:hypothetical protein PGB90_004881 [Kerria lacca]